MKSDGVKITSLELANVKKIKAVALTPAQDGLTVIGGRNGAGKTSVLDGIAWALGGDRFKPDAAKRSDSVLDPELRIQLSNGLAVVRKGPRSALTVIDTTGKRSGQSLLNSFIEVLALDLPKFLSATDKDRATILLSLLGIQDQLDAYDRQEQMLYDQRTQTGRDRDQARNYAEGLSWHDGVPEEPLSVSELTDRLKAAQKVNLEIRNRTTRDGLLQRSIEDSQRRLQELRQTIADIEQNIEMSTAELKQLRALDDDIQPVDEESIMAQIKAVDEINAHIRDNKRFIEADQRAETLAEQYTELSLQIDRVREQRMELLKGVDMPLPGLSVRDGVLTYNDQPWSCMSSAEQLRAATAIVGRLKPECKFVLVDKLEQMDVQTLADFGEWAAAQGLQVIGTRVSTGDECTIIIDDGEVAGEEKTEEKPKWTEGTF